MTISLTSTEIDCDFVKVLVFGDSGMGKTTLIKTAPRPIIISSESGLLSLKGTNISVIKVTSLEDMEEAYEYVTDPEHSADFLTICLDSITDLAETMLTSNKKGVKDPRMAYGKLNDDIMDIIRAFRDISTHHVYFTAKMARIEDVYSGFAKYKAMMPGKVLPQNIPYMFDEILCLQIGEDEEGLQFRYLQTQPSITHDSKDRSGKLDNPERPDLAYIFEKITGKNKNLTKKVTN